jgi:organic radical activating enzyme
MNTLEKLAILADGAKYDVSCASSGVNRNNKGGLGNSKAYGICHTWSSDGRCISLLKLLLTNYCIYNCTYCVNRNQNDILRASLTPREVADLTIQFYRRNYIEGLFLSSAIERSPNHTMDNIYQVLNILRNEYNFYGYIHVKVIPGADPALIHKTGMLADRMSVNIELPSEQSLKLLAPQKTLQALISPMDQIKNEIAVNSEERKKLRHVRKFVPAGQSTQMIIGATNDSDLVILKTTATLLIHSDNVRSQQKKALKKLMLYFSDVQTLNPYTISWSGLHYHRNNVTYKMLIKICFLIIKGLLQTTREGRFKLASFLDNQQMHRLYEKFVLAYYQKHYPHLRPTSSLIDWNLDVGSDSQFLPAMKTDITL